MVWAHFEEGKWTYLGGGSPYDKFGPGGRQIAHEGGSHYTYSARTGGGVTRWDWVADPRTAAPAAAPPPDASIVTGIDPSQIHNALYGKIIPLSVLGSSNGGGGLVRIGTAGLIFGPYFSGGSASFAVSFGFPANPEGTRRVYEIALDSKIAWELAAGSPDGVLNPAGFLGDPFECRFYAGTQTQAADPLEVAMFGAQAVAYRPHVMLWFTNLPVTQFDGKLPFVSCKIGDVTGGAVAGDGINLGEALEAVAYSPWLEYDSSSFEATGVADIVQGMILTEDQSFLNLLQVTARVYRTLDVIQTDKLRVNDRGATVTPDLSLHRDHISEDGGVEYMRQEEASVPRELELITIDPDADFVFMPSKAARPLAPVPVTSSVAKETVTLPVVIGATTRASLVTFAKYQEDNARKRISLQTMAYGYELEPGDLFNMSDLAEGFDPSEIFKVVETSHGANYINEIVGEAILKCAIGFDDGGDPYFPDNILLLHGNTDAPVPDHSQYDEAMALEGNAYIDTSVKVFGAGAFRFDGTADRVATTSTGETQWNFSPTNTSPYTIECWARFDEVGRTPSQMLVARNFGLINHRLWNFYNPAATTELTFSTTSNGTSITATVTTAGAALVNDVWYHLAVDKDSTGKIRIYVNGVMRASDTPADSVIVNLVVAPISVGCSGSDDFQNPFIGYIDDVRITARSRYGDIYGDAGFAVPTAAFPDHV